MSNDKTIRELIDGLIACDDQPPDERLTELRKSLEQKVINRNTRGRYAVRVFSVGFVLLVLGVVLILAADRIFQNTTWLLQVGFGVLIAGGAVTILGAIGRASSHGMGYLWARHDLHDAAIMELSLQVQRLTERIDALDKPSSSQA